MQKTNYDYSCLVWSPQGRLYQVEYSMEAVNHGTCLLGLKSKTHVVLCGLKLSKHETLGFYRDKLYSVSNHLGMGFSGIIPDGLILQKLMKSECLNYNYVYDSDYPVERLVTKISESKIKNIYFFTIFLLNYRITKKNFR